MFPVHPVFSTCQTGVDSVDHAIAPADLQEIRRLLASGGRFAPAHNRAYRDISVAPTFRRPLLLRGMARTVWRSPPYPRAAQSL